MDLSLVFACEEYKQGGCNFAVLVGLLNRWVFVFGDYSLVLGPASWVFCSHMHSSWIHDPIPFRLGVAYSLHAWWALGDCLLEKHWSNLGWLSIPVGSLVVLVGRKRCLLYLVSLCNWSCGSIPTGSSWCCWKHRYFWLGGVSRAMLLVQDVRVIHLAVWFWFQPRLMFDHEQRVASFGYLEAE
jgi:hypothetical protein